MACLCTDLLGDLSVKFDLIEELVDTILDLLQKSTGGRIKQKIPGIDWTKLQKESNELIEIMSIVLKSGILN